MSPLMSPQELVLLFLLLSHTIVASEAAFLVKSLPGYSGDLPFKLETGYVGVGDLDEVQLFYYFIESESNPQADPLVLWLTGGPGCSAFSGLVYEIGPLLFDYANYTGTKPTFVLNPYSWTKVANIIFLDQPVGTGFSYANTSEGYNTSDTSSAAQSYEFLRKWLMDHPQFVNNPLYIAGDSYSGITVPMIVQEISNGEEDGDEVPLNLKGYVLGNPWTDSSIEKNARVQFAHRMALISDELYESAKTNCNDEYVTVSPYNAPCLQDLDAITECLQKVNEPQVLEPKCRTLSPKPRGILERGDDSFLRESFLDIIVPQEHWCREYDYLFSYIWANDKTVQDALHVREGTVRTWERCNDTLSDTYTYDVTSTVDYHRNFTKTNYRALIYSGDHDKVVPYVGTEKWIRSLNLTLEYSWRPWLVNAQVAGYTKAYTLDKYSLTYVTVKGGGHTAPEYKPKECLSMIDI